MPWLRLAAFWWFCLVTAPGAYSQARFSIEGVVLDELGNDSPNAPVWLIRSSWIPTEVSASVTGADGRFSFGPVFTTRLGMSGHPLTYQLVGWRPGYAIASRRVDFQTLSFGERLRLELRRESPWSLYLEDAGGRPVINAVVEVLKVGGTVLPEVLTRWTATRSDSDGRVLIDTFSTEDLAALRVTHPSVGAQKIQVRRDDPRRFRLLPTRAWGQGELVTDFPPAARSRALRIVGVGGGPPSSPNVSFDILEVETDALGRFRVPDFAPRIWIDLVPSAEYPDRHVVPDWSDSGFPRVRLEKSYPVTGSVREAGTSRPVAGARLKLINPVGLAAVDHGFVITGRDGRFATHVRPGTLKVELWELPGAYVFPGIRPQFPRSILLDASSQRVIEPIEIARGAVIEGVVVDESGTRVANAWVWAARHRADGDATERSYGETLSDGDGVFRLSGLALGADYLVRARRKGKTSDLVVRTTPSPRPKWLELSADRMTSITGNVVDLAGDPVVGASIRITMRVRDAAGRRLRSYPLSFGEARLVKTRDDGAFETPAWVRSGDEVRVRVESGRSIVESTPWLEVAPERPATAGNIRVRRLYAARGRVVDSASRPIPNARVYHRGDMPDSVAALTGAEGAFTLEFVDPGLPLLFASAEGYRLGGVVAERGAEHVITLVATDEAPPGVLPFVHSVGRDERVAMARQVLAPLFGRVRGDGTGRERELLIEGLAAFDSETARRLVNEAGGNEQLRDSAWLVGGSSTDLAALPVSDDEWEIHRRSSGSEDLNRLRAVATRDPARALALAERERERWEASFGNGGVTEYDVGRLLAVSAVGFAQSEPARARAILERGVNHLEHYERWLRGGTGARAVAMVLPLVMIIDASLVETFAWRSLASRSPYLFDYVTQNAVQDDARHALLLYPYDPRAARAVFAPRAAYIVRVIKEWESGTMPNLRLPYAEAFAALALDDPKRAVAALDELPKGPRGSGYDLLEMEARAVVAAVTTREGEDLWYYLRARFFSWMMSGVRRPGA